jgi:hypothetical protein
MYTTSAGDRYCPLVLQARTIGTGIDTKTPGLRRNPARYQHGPDIG